GSEEALYLLATCYFRSGKAYKAYRLLKTHTCSTPQCRYLLAKCWEKLDPEQIFRLSSLHMAPPPPVSPAQNPSHRLDTALMETPQDTLELNRLNLESSNGKLTSDSPGSYIDSSLISPDPGSLLANAVSMGSAGSLLGKQNKPKSGRSLLGGPAALSPLTPSFGILPLDPSPGDSTYLQNYSGSLDTQQTAPSKKVLSPTLVAPPNIQPRRSTRLFTSASSTAKENSKKLKMKFPTKIPNRKTKCKAAKTANSNLNESLDILKLDSSMSDSKSLSTPGYQSISLQRAATDAINILSSVPAHHYNTGWVLTHIGRAYFELAEYTQAYRVEGMEIYSTTLWHLQKDVALSALSKDLTDMDRLCPQAWCVAGNCFSLQQEHDIAIKFFQRAIQ
ncbi:hypothetical protein CRUP_026967, partial [Coryphaenoides rupestris]